jgi:SAM-dependent methyltransferase
VSEPYTPDNLLDRHTAPETLAAAYEAQEARERELLQRHLRVQGGVALSIGAGWNPGRHLLPADRWRLVAVDLDPERPAWAVSQGTADEGFPGRAGELHELADGSYDLVLYRLVLHHVAYAQPLEPVFAEAARLLRPGGALVAIEPSAWHPVGAALVAANKLGLGVKVHGTPDDVPLSPRTLVRLARSAGLAPELHAVTYGWRRLPRRAGRLVERLDRHGSRPCARWLGHTEMLIAYR